MATGRDLPLFPLNAVLFPEGQLQLRIFEPRYLDLVRDSAARGSGFGICLILEGRESGAPAVPAAVGTLAQVTDFDLLPDGLLGITATGSERLRVEATRVRDNGLVHGRVTLLGPEPRLEVPAQHGLLVQILERMLERAGGAAARAPRSRYDDAAWVAFRLAELLPLESAERQQLLQQDDPLERLDRLATWLPRFQRA